MSLYTFYCCQPDGSAATFEARELASEGDARAHAAKLVQEHTSCAYVTVFDDEREILTERRDAADPSIRAASLALAGTAIGPGPLIRTLSRGRANGLGIALIVTTYDGHILFWNDAATRLYGWTPQEVVGRDVVEVTPAAPSQRQAAEIMRTLQTGQPWADEILLRGKDRRAFRAFVADIPLGPLTRESGMIVGASAVVERRDVVEAHLPTLLKQLEALSPPKRKRAR